MSLGYHHLAVHTGLSLEAQQSMHPMPLPTTGGDPSAPPAKLRGLRAADHGT